MNPALPFGKDAQRDPPAKVMPRRVFVPGWPDRQALIVTPAASRARGLAVELHGSGLDPDGQRSMSRLVDQLLPLGFAVLFPEAAIPFELSPALKAGFAWNVPGTPLPGADGPLITPVDDMRWIDEIIEVARCELSLEIAPLFLVGYSGGARLASHLLVNGRVPWTAAALVSGLRAVERADHAPPPTIAFHGLDDRVNPYGGGSNRRWDMSVVDAADRYAAAQGCLTGFRETQNPHGTLRSYWTADSELGLTLYSIANAGHAWPGSTDSAFGPSSVGLDASSLVASFFDRHASTGETHSAELASRISAASAQPNRAAPSPQLAKKG